MAACGLMTVSFNMGSDCLLLIDDRRSTGTSDGFKIDDGATCLTLVHSSVDEHTAPQATAKSLVDLSKGIVTGLTLIEALKVKF